MKKGQLEILGLAVVVLLLSFGLLLVLRFTISGSDDTPIKKSSTESQQASNLLASILRTSTDCKKTDMSMLIQDCFTGPYITNCPVNSNYMSSSMTVLDSCGYVNASLSYLFNQTFDVWQKKYVFKIEYSGSTPFLLTNLGNNPDGSLYDDCPGEADGTEFPLPTNIGQTLFISFKICS